MNGREREQMLESMTAQQYVDEQNAQHKAKYPDSCWVLVCDHRWENGLEAARALAICELSDAFKEANGVRPRHYNYSEMSLSQLEEETERCYADCE